MNHNTLWGKGTLFSEALGLNLVKGLGDKNQQNIPAQQSNSHSWITSLSNTSLSHQQIQFQLVCGVNLNQISLLYMLTYVKSQSPPNHRKPFSAFLWGDSDQASPPLRVRNGAFQICRRLGQILGEDLILLNQPVQSVTFGKFPSEGKKIFNKYCFEFKDGKTNFN